MLTAREYLDMSSDASDGTKTRELHNAICEYLDSLTLETADPKAKHLLLKLHELDCGPYFDNDIAINSFGGEVNDVEEVRRARVDPCGSLTFFISKLVIS